MKPIRLILVCSALSACGTVDAAKNALAKKSAPEATAQAALTDEAANQTTADATSTAEANDAAPDDAASVPPPDETPPAFLEAVKAARDYTRKLLGLDDSALQAFKAKVAATRALSSTPEEFKTKIAAAEAEFQAALATQQANADAARVTHADELGKIFDGTVAVFSACGAGMELGQHEPGMKKGDRHDGRGPGKGHDKGPEGLRMPGGDSRDGDGDGRGHDRDSGVEPGDGPRMMVGNGELKGDFAAMRKQQSQLAASPECKAASDALIALIPVQPAN